MAVWQILPTSGPVSGPSFETQIERAINELSEQADGSSLNAQAALEAARQAGQTANEALAVANNAQTAAESAHEAADLAQKTADTAQAMAQGADAKADQALNTADAASAQVSVLTGDMDNLSVSVNRVESEMASVSGQASQALEMASNMLVYEIPEEVIADLNELTEKAENIYIWLGEDEEPEEVPANLPVESAGYLTVRLDNNGDYILQRFQVVNAGTYYERWGVITPQDEADPIITWGKWYSGSGSSARFDLTLEESLPADTPLTVPVYTVGANKLRVEYESIPCVPGPDGTYQEVGNAGEQSTSIVFNLDLPAGTELAVIAAR